MANSQKKSILRTIISLSEKIEGCKMEKSFFLSEKEDLGRLANYLDVDEISALFFAVIFINQNQHGSAVNMTDIADYLSFPHLHMLEYSANFTLLKRKNLIVQKDSEGAFSRSSRDAGFEIPESVADCILEGAPIIHFQDNDDSLEKTFESFFNLFKMMKHSADDDKCEFYRKISNLERKSEGNEIVKNIRKEFPADMESRAILYLLSAQCLTGKCVIEADDEFENLITEIMPAFVKYSRCKKIDDEQDILFEKNLIKRELEDIKDGLGMPYYIQNLKLTANGIRILFGNEAENYLAEIVEKNDFEKTYDALREFGRAYERKMNIIRKRSKLRDMERRFSNLPFFSDLNKTKINFYDRFILYDIAADFSTGNDSCLTATIEDIYGKNDDYFKALRSFLDEKHELVTEGFVVVDKNEIPEKSTVTLSQKSIELLYGENADLYMKRGVSGKNIIAPEDLKEKSLFYSEKVQKQIDTLEESLCQENLVAMQKRLESKGLSKGIAVLLYGAPGTGKTETVYQLARKTNRKIYHVDIADSKSMWFGESEKIIKRIFTDYRQLCKTAERHGENTPILLFNEADALISKRRDVGSGNTSQTENAIQNILLEEMEKLDGLVFATTNLCNNMDKAFERRFLFKVEYEKPDLEIRKKIWKSKLNVLTDEDLDVIAKRFDFSGGEIDNIVRKCEITEIIKGVLPSREEIVELCENERLEKEQDRIMGFCVN